MKSQLITALLAATSGATVAITLSVAAAMQPPAAAPAEITATSPQQYAEYRNDLWHFSIFVPSNFTAASYENRGGQTIQFIDPAGYFHFQVSAWPYHDLVVHTDGLQLQPASTDADQPDELGTVHVFQDDLFELTFVKNGIGYVVQALPENATSTLDILKSWEFI